MLLLLLQGDPDVTRLFSQVPPRLNAIRARLFHYRLNVDQRGGPVWTADAGTSHTASIELEDNLNDSDEFALPTPSRFGLFWRNVQQRT